MWDSIFLKHILKNRNFTEEEIEKYINQHYTQDIKIPYFYSFLNLVKKSNSILIVGDYDVDGVVSTSMLFFVLKQLFGNEKKINVFIPNRFRHGYGLNKNTVEFIINQYRGKIDTIITVDNGISSYNEIECLKKEGLKIIVIDHHKPDHHVPKADIIVHPHFFDIGYGYLCASGLVYKLSLFLLNWIKNNETLEKVFTFLAGMATIADVVPLLEDNRKIVKKMFGLLRSQYIPYPIFRMFSKAYGKETIPSNSFHFSYIIIPRLNAPGRIDDPLISFKLIYKTIKQSYTNEEEDIETELQEIENINIRRQQIQKKILDKIIKNIQEKEFYNNSIIIPDYIEEENGLELGVVGIVAGKISNHYKKPTFILVKRGDVLKGSIRNPIDGLDITDVISNYKELVIKFGGHKKAAGLEISVKNFDEFRKKIQNSVNLKYKQNVDLELSPYFFTKFIKNIDRIISIMEPFGENNEKPTIKIEDFNNKFFNVNNNYLLIDNNKVFISPVESLISIPENDSKIFLKFNKIDYKGKEKFIFLENLSVQKETNLSNVKIDRILFVEKIYSNSIHFVKISIKSENSLFLFLNSYNNYAIITNKEMYERIFVFKSEYSNNRIFASHIFIEKNVINNEDLQELLEKLPEKIFITNKDVFKGIIIVYFDTYPLRFNFDPEINLRKGVIFIKLSLDFLEGKDIKKDG